MDGTGGNNNIQSTPGRSYRDEVSQREQDISKQLAAGFLGEHGLLHRALPPPAGEGAASQPNLAHGIQSHAHHLPFRQFNTVLDAGLAQGVQSADFVRGSAAPRSALLGHLAAALDQRRLSETDSWHAEVLRSDTFFSPRNYDAAKRESCTDSSADVEYLLAGGLGLQSMRRTSSATASHALAAGGLLPGPPRPASLTAASGIPPLSSGPQTHLPSLSSGVGPTHMLHQQAPQRPLPSEAPGGPTSVFNGSQHNHHDLPPQQQQQQQELVQQQLMSSPAGSVPSIRISAVRMRDTVRSETLGSGIGATPRHDCWSEEGASVSGLSSGQASGMSLPLIRNTNTIPTGQDCLVGASAAPLAVPEQVDISLAANRELSYQHAARFETPFGCISPAVPCSSQSQELQAAGAQHPDPRVGLGTAVAGIDTCGGGINIAGGRGSPAVISGAAGPGHDRFQCTLGSSMLGDAGGGAPASVADVDERHISASAFLEFASEAGVFGGGGGTGRVGGNDAPRSPSHLSVIAMQLSRQQQQSQQSLLTPSQQQQLRQSPRGGLSVQQMVQPGSMYGTAGPLVLRSAATLQESPARLSGAGATNAPQLPGGGGSTGGGYAPPPLLGHHGIGGATGDGGRSPVMASPRHTTPQQALFTPHPSPLQHSSLVAQAQLQQLQALQQQQQQPHDQLHTPSPGRMRVMAQQQQQEPRPSSPYGHDAPLQQQQPNFATPPRGSSSQSAQGMALPRQHQFEEPGLQQYPHYQPQQPRAITQLMQHLQQQASSQQRRPVAVSNMTAAAPRQHEQLNQQAAAAELPDAAGLKSLVSPIQQKESQNSAQFQKLEGAEVSRAGGGSEQNNTGHSLAMQQQQAQPQEGQQLGVMQQSDGPLGTGMFIGMADKSPAAVAAMARASRQMKRRRTSPRPSLKVPPNNTTWHAEQNAPQGPAPGSNNQPSQPSAAGPAPRTRSVAVASPTRSLQRRTTSLSGVGGGPVHPDISAAGGPTPTATATTISTRLFSESEGEEVQRRHHDGYENERDDGQCRHNSDSSDDGSDGADSSPDTAIGAATGDEVDVVDGRVGSSRRSRTAIGGGIAAAGGSKAGGRTAAGGHPASAFGTGNGGGELGSAGGAESLTVIDPVTGMPRRRAMTQEERMVRNREAAAKSRARRHQYQQSLEQHIRELQQHSAELRLLLESHAVPLPAHLHEQQARLGDGLPPPPPRTSPPRSRKGIGGRPRKYPLNPDGSKPSRKRRRTSTGTALTTAATPVPVADEGTALADSALAVEAAAAMASIRVTEGPLAAEVSDPHSKTQRGLAAQLLNEDSGHAGEGDDGGEAQLRGRGGARGGRGRRGRGRGRGGGRAVARTSARKNKSQSADVNDETDDGAGSGPSEPGDVAVAHKGASRERDEAVGTMNLRDSSSGATTAKCGDMDSIAVVGKALLAATKALSERYQSRGPTQGATPTRAAGPSGRARPAVTRQSSSPVQAGEAAVYESPLQQQPFTMAHFLQYQYVSPLAPGMTSQQLPPPLPPPQQQRQQQQQPRRNEPILREAVRVEARPDTLSPVRTEMAAAAGASAAGPDSGDATAADTSQPLFAPWQMPLWPPPLSVPAPRASMPATADTQLASPADASGRQAPTAGVTDPRVASAPRITAADGPQVPSSIALLPLAQAPGGKPLDLGSGQLERLSGSGSGGDDGGGGGGGGRPGAGAGEVMRPLSSPEGIAGPADGSNAGPSSSDMGPFDMLGFGFGDLLGGFLGNQ